MGKNEQIQKELDLLLEKIRFWRYSFLAVVSSLAGILFGISQGKVILNFLVISLWVSGILLVYLSIRRLSLLQKEYYSLLDDLKQED